MRHSTYMTRALRSKDRRYALVLGRLGYATPLDAPVCDPLDDDGDGQKGGSAKQNSADAEIALLRAEYLEVFGKRPFHGWDAEELKARIAEIKTTIGPNGEAS